ncbi:hypothetical protein ACHQM5_020708 [Ranunculus cassubicifolius]
MKKKEGELEALESPSKFGVLVHSFFIPQANSNSNVVNKRLKLELLIRLQVTLKWSLCISDHGSVCTLPPL